MLERTLYRHLYGRSHLDQVLFSIGLVFMAVAATDYLMGSAQRIIQLPAWLQGRLEILGVSVGIYRCFIIVICGAADARPAMGALAHALRQPPARGGRRSRASRAGSASTCSTVFAATFAFGSGLAGLGGALGAEILGLDPYFPLKFMIYFLIVVTVGGTSSITGRSSPRCCSASPMSPANITCRSSVPFVIYSVMIVVLIWRPQRSVRARTGLAERATSAPPCLRATLGAR